MGCEKGHTARFPAREWFGSLLEAANNDSEARAKMGDLRGHVLFHIGDTRLLFKVSDTRLELMSGPGMDDSWDVAFCGPESSWQRLFSPSPPAHAQCFMALRIMDPHFDWEGNQLFAAQMLPVLERLVELARGIGETEAGPGSAQIASDAGPAITRDPTQIRGRYVDLPGSDGQLARIYYEEAGTGLPILMLHTAGADSRQFHELLADTELASRWRLLAFDLPFHGRSTPPEGWWRSPYRLTTDDYAHWCLTFIREVAGGKVVLLGCSMGAAMSVYLAARHPDDVSAAIALEAPDRSPGRLNRFLSNPQVNQACYAPTYVYGLMNPKSPQAARRRAWWYYSQGGYGVYAGDLHFYSLEWDASRVVKTLDTSATPLYLMTGAYDYSATPEATRRLAEMIPGANFTIMEDLGHFPMTENPDRFRSYLVPVLEELEERLSSALQEHTKEQ